MFLMPRRFPRRPVIPLKKSPAAVAFKSFWPKSVEDFKLSPVGLATWAVVVFALFAGFVHILDLFGDVEDSVFDCVDGGVIVNIVVIFVDRAYRIFSGFLS